MTTTTIQSAFVLPGEPIPVPSSSKSITFGPGIVAASSSSKRAASANRQRNGGEGNVPVVASKAGMVMSRDGKEKGKAKDTQGGLIWVESLSKRYVPANRDLVLGTIIARHAEGYRVDIGSSSMATLDALAFEGATKRSKPNLKIGTLVYARVSSATRDTDPELECSDPSTGKSDGFGELKGGVVVNVSLQLSRQLLTLKDPLLLALASVIPFEIAIGINGRVWFRAGSITETIALKRTLEGVDDGTVGSGKGEVEKAAKNFMA